MRVVLFGSFYRGFFVLNELLSGPLRQQVQVVGVATDDPAQAFLSPGKRVWQYPHTRHEELMVAELAREQGFYNFHPSDEGCWSVRCRATARPCSTCTRCWNTPGPLPSRPICCASSSCWPTRSTACGCPRAARKPMAMCCACWPSWRDGVEKSRQRFQPASAA